jgi:hypothetical protein
MSYLDVPRLHFSGTFTANPSTINNDPTNYDPSLVNGPDPNPENIGLVLSWNPYGSHAFTISAQVTSFVDSSGQLHAGGDPLIGASFASYMPQQNPAKLVDLDTQQQGVTRLFGLYLQLTLAGGGSAVLQGLWENGGTLLNLWTRVPSGQGDSAYGGAFQSVLKNLQWSTIAGSSLLQQLQEAAGQGLSVRLNTYGYQNLNTSPGFRTGLITGTIGPQLAGEPLHLTPRLLLPPNPSSPVLAWAPAKVNSQVTTVTIDLGNSIPEQSPGGPPVQLGTLEAAVLSGSTPTSLGTIDLGSLQQTAGVVQFPITSQQAGQPLAILVNGTPQLAENSNGSYIDVDGASLYMNPGDQASVNVWATSFGSPAAGVSVPLGLVPNPPPKGFDNNTPASALTFPDSVKTGADGSASIPLQASDPSELPPARQNIGGQLYFLGGFWQVNNVGPGPLNVKLLTPSASANTTNPTWSNVQPILFKYYYLYGYMASIVDLSNYDDVAQNAQIIKHVLLLDFGDPNYMPVSREMSNADRQTLLTWIANGCPAGNLEETELFAGAPEESKPGSVRLRPENPWKG